MRSGAIAVACILCMSIAALASQPLVVHEWGTFTSFQDEQGRTIGGINVDDEPVPGFVHNLDPFLLVRESELPPIFFQGAPRAHPDVTMRLETPVIYFHPPSPEPLTVDVRASFHSGWLTEYYPDAEADAPGLRSGHFQFGPITPDTIGRLTWRNLEVGPERPGPVTDKHVWLAPRAVDAADVTTPKGQSERFLFYRGVGNVEAPLQVARGGDLLFIQQLREAAGEPVRPPLWLLDVRRDGAAAFRVIEELPQRPPAAPVSPATFEDQDYRRDNIAALREQMHDALVAEGLFSDEAEALLNTWELSYFKSAGTRLFFLVPQDWTDRVLPLEISVPAEVTRVMVGRIELVTPRHRELLRRISEGPVQDGQWLAEVIRASDPQSRQPLLALFAGEAPLRDFVEMPEEYQAFLDLGRFRMALLLDELRRRPTEPLELFVRTYGLSAYEPPEVD